MTRSTTPLRILHLEESNADAELIAATLENLQCEIVRVATRESFFEALERERVDVVLSDMSLPAFDGASALRMVRSKYPSLPFIFVSSRIGDEAAVELLKRGATDYVLMDRPSRLISAIERAVHEAAELMARQRTDGRNREQAEFLDKAQDAICAMNPDGTMMYWNVSAGRLYDFKDQVQKFPLALTDPERFEEVKKAALDSGEWHGELVRTTGNRRATTVDSRWTLFRDHAGVPRSILVIDTDVTERKAMEAQLLRLQRLESIGALASGIAHDLNNVLAPVLMAVDLLRYEIQTATSERLIETIQISAQRGAGLVQQVLSFARGTMGEAAVLELRHLICELTKMLRDTLPKSICIKVDLAPDLLPVKGYPTQLHQVLMNLSVNARNAMPAGGILSISAQNVSLADRETKLQPHRLNGSFVLVKVADTGIGIPDELRERIFEPFFTTQEHGTGLGLPTVVNIVKAHGGFLEVTSEEGKGTCFDVYFPVVTTSMSLGHPAGQPALPTGNKELILVVDDETAVLEMMRDVLISANYHVLTAHLPTVALRIFSEQRQKIRMVLCDIAMPIMDGVRLAEEIRKIDPAALLVCMTGLNSPNSLERVQSIGAQALLMKPFTMQELLVNVAKVLETNKAETPLNPPSTH